MESVSQRDEGWEIEREIVAACLGRQTTISRRQRSLRACLQNTSARFGLHIAHCLSALLGDDIFGRYLRKQIFRLAGAKLGPHASIYGDTWISNPRNLTMDLHSLINRRCYLDLQSTIKFGKFAGAGHGVTFVTTIHEFVPGANLGVGMTAKPIVVEDRAWIGANATILPGVTIGEDSVVAACALVTRDVPPNTLVVGNPARVARRNIRNWIEQARQEAEDQIKSDSDSGRAEEKSANDPLPGAAHPQKYS